MTALDHTPAEKALINQLDGATGWLAQLRDATLKGGMPTRRDEMWKWSDLRRAAGPIAMAGEIELVGLDLGETIAADGDRFELNAIAGAGTSAAARTLIVPAGVSATLVERYRADAGSAGNVHLDIRIEPGAKLDRVGVIESDADGILVTSARIEIGEGGKLNQVMLTSGGKLVRDETHIMHAGEGAEADLGAVYLLEEGRHADFTSSVHHTGPGGITRQLVKGAAAARARGVFQGKFHVERAAQQTDARMTHRALMLDERAEIDAKPELEIYADDVQCAHGNALGAIDETALFYMRQRGLSELKARAMLIESFLIEPLDMISDEELRANISSTLRERLDGLA
jgi:Fe-S cluster assembly protein SufD